MSEAKPIWASRTFWANLVGGAAMMLSALGLDIEALNLGPGQQEALIGGILVVTNVILRTMTERPVTLTKDKGIRCSPVTGLATLLIVLALGGCGSESFRQAFPATAAGWEAGGVLGAVDGAAGALLARCRMFDGTEIRVAFDDLAVVTGSEDTLERIRRARHRICAGLGAVEVIVGGLAVPVVVETVEPAPELAPLPPAKP